MMKLRMAKARMLTTKAGTPPAAVRAWSPVNRPAASMLPTFRHDFSRIRIHADVEADPAASRGSSAPLPEPLKAGVERLSGVAVDDVRVHADSPVPAVLGTHAFTWGRHIHVGPGQQHHLPHEAWHAAQQLGGRVAATEARAGVALNADPRLEGEADRMGAAAVTGATADVCANRGAPAVAGGGPATRAPVMQGRLMLEGWLWDKLALLDRINAASSIRFHLDADGFLSSGGKSSEVPRDEFSRQMEASIADAQTVVFRLVRGNPNFTVDSLPTGEVNVDNLLKMPDPVFQNWMIHVLAERFAIPNYESSKEEVGSSEEQYQAEQEHRKSTAELAHDVGHDAQARQLRELYPGLTIAFRGEDPEVDETTRRVDAQGNGTIELRFDFTDVALVKVCPVVAGKIKSDQPIDWRIDVTKGAAP
jgi:hypothetical protein